MVARHLVFAGLFEEAQRKLDLKETTMRSRIASEKLAVLGITLMLMTPLLCSASSIIYTIN